MTLKKVVAITLGWVVPIAVALILAFGNVSSAPPGPTEAELLEIFLYNCATDNSTFTVDGREYSDEYAVRSLLESLGLTEEADTLIERGKSLKALRGDLARRSQEPGADYLKLKAEKDARVQAELRNSSERLKKVLEEKIKPNYQP